MPDWVHMVTSADKIPGLTTEEALANLKRGIRERKCRYCAHLIQDVSNDEEFTCALMHSVGTATWRYASRRCSDARCGRRINKKVRLREDNRTRRVRVKNVHPHRKGNGMPRIRAEVSMLTVKTATELLASLGRKPNYRPLSKNRIAQYVAAIKSGRWRDNGNTIGIDPEGVMINGQHRCHAVIIAKQSIPVIFVYGIRYIEEIDTHQPRTLQQLLNYRGEKNAHILSACLRMVFDYQGG